MDSYKTAKKYLYYLLARREYSQVELTRKLKERAIEPSIIQQLLAEFIAEGYQSDLRFAESFIRGKANKCFGPLKVINELKTHNIDNSQYQLALSETDVDWLDVIFRTYHKKYGDSPWIDFNDKQKRTRYLQQRGFSFDLINQVFRELT